MIKKLLTTAAGFHNVGIQLTRIGLVIVLLWIGALKVYNYEADGIVPFVANSPVMSFFYAYDSPEYKKHKNKEGEYVEANRKWHESNNTYSFALGLGAVICIIGLMIAAYPISPKISALGSFLCFGMSFVTLSFLITSPEVWVPDLGSGEHGFPLLSGAGRLVIKDVVMMGAALVTMSEASRLYLKRQRKNQYR